MTNLQTIQALYAGFATGDMPAILANMAPDIAWTEAEGYPYAGTFHGPQAIVDGVFIKLATEWDGYQAVPERYVSEGDDVVALGHYSGTYKATGNSFRAPFVHAWTVQGGRIVRFVQYVDTVLVQRALQQG
ncbi:nuclear transport factor 2 family protein [Pseudacidovorax intermedius]|uniref:Ketosteroid isomerase n=1 Tax=Pseudacidovorax intermedius TaxID=433924 RepID=A0A147GUA8_9BURK|nr:nuclear transport factor 2 family protein [Pseudacidovorax intermedius]KTT21246.1 ketosteroid isomerase [Pseudacidovorax intermedius]